MTTANKYDSFLKDFLSINKSISFEKIGELLLDSNMPSTEETTPVLVGNFVFKYNKKAQTSDELIQFISERAQKNKTLIESDIYSYLDQARELMNTGKPWILQGVGIFSINMAGEYQFSVAEFKPEDNKPARKDKPQKEYGRTRNEHKNQSAVKMLTFFIVIALIAGVVWVTYEYFLKDKFTTAASNQNTPTTADTITQDNGSKALDSNRAALTINATDSISFKFVFETTSILARAKDRIAKLKSYGNSAGYDSLHTDTGIIYDMYILKKAIPADTTAIRDSLAKFFKKPVSVHIPVH